jgi:predicted aspartyl protease
MAGLLMFIASLALPAVARADCQMSQVSRLPLTPAHGHVLVPVALDDKPAQLIFDTGAFTTLIAAKAADRIGLPHMHDQDKSGLLTTVGGIGGEKSAMAVTARSVDIGGLKGRDYNFLSADFNFEGADGLLSVDLISQFDVDLDFPDNQVVLYRPRGDCRAPAAFLSGPLYAVPLHEVGQDRRPRVMVTVGGQTLLAMIDTGASHSAIFRRAAARIGLNDADLAADPHAHAYGVGSNVVSVARHAFEPVTIGDLTFEHMSVDVLDEHGLDEVEMLLGADFQHAVHLWISYSSGMLIMQYPPRPSKKM